MEKLLKLLLLSILTLGLLSCGGGDDDDPAQPEVTVPTNDENPADEEDDDNTRILRTTNCVDRPGSVTSRIRKEKRSGEDSKLFYYDCPGGPNTCSRAFEIKTSESDIPPEDLPTGEDSGKRNCLTHVSDPDIFNVCAVGAIIYDGENRSWEYVVFEGTRNGSAVELQCEGDYPKHNPKISP